jgi:hypothetical protein
MFLPPLRRGCAMSEKYRGRHTSPPHSASTLRTGLRGRKHGRHLRAHAPRRSHRRAAVIMACTLVLAGVLVSLPHATATRATFRFTASADAYVTSAKPTRNFARTPALRADAFPKIERSYLRFAVTQLPGAVTAARLQLYAESGTQGGYAVREVVGGDWSEGEITYATAPPLGRVLARSGSVTRDSWTSVDLTAFILGQGVVNLALTTDDRSAGLYASRETGMTAPQLVVETVEGTTLSNPTSTTALPTTASPTTAPPKPTSSSTTITTAPAPTSPPTTSAPTSGTLTYGTPERPFAASSAWNRPIPAGASLAPNSAGMIQRLTSGGHYNVTSGAWGQYGPPVFYADASTPRYTWGSHCGMISGKQVPIPPGSHEAQGPGANNDHKYIVIDTDAKLVYDIWGADVEGRDCLKWGYQGYGVIESLTTANDGHPAINGEQAPTGAGTSSLAGLLRGYDVTHLDEDGTYGHALQGASMYSAKGRWVSPATKSDGPDTHPDAIPQGARLQLNPSFNCGAISTPGIRAYCRTAQKYGIILMDTTPVHALTIYQEDVKDNTPATGNPFVGGYWGTDADWPSLAKVPLSEFHVVAPLF